VRLLAVEFGDDPFVGGPIASARLLGLFQADARVPLDDGREVARHDVKSRGLFVEGPFELDAGFQCGRVVVVDRQPDIVGERQQVLAHRLQVFQNLPRP
jgi:hypothetical protein